MTLKKGRLRLSADYIPAACLCLCAVVFGRRFPAACLCVLLHEGAHIAVLLSLSDDVIEITLGCMSADIIDRGRLSRSDAQQAMISAAGPIANLVFAAVFRYLYIILPYDLFRECTMISAAVGAFNLLPISVTDGGELAAMILRRVFSERTASIVTNAITIVFLIPLCVLAFYVLLRSKNNFTLLLAAMSVAHSVLRGAFE